LAGRGTLSAEHAVALAAAAAPGKQLHRLQQPKGKGKKKKKQRKLDAALQQTDSNTNTEWEWGGCGDNINYGVRKSREWMDAPFRKRSDMSDIKTLVMLHNNDAGRLVGPKFVTYL